MKYWKVASAVLVSAGLFAGAADAAAPLCTTQNELSALRTAALQQQLMVAGLTCHATDAYNRFVLAYRPELQRSDAELKAYFIRRGGEHGEAEYDSFKTKLANLASLSNTADGRAYCANARVSFEMAMRGQSLANYVAGQQLVVALPEQRLCIADRQVLASANTSPAAGVKDEEVYVPHHSAPPQLGSGPAPVRVAGVPAYSMPASPYQDSNDVVAMAPPPAAAPAPAAYAPQPYDYYGDEDAPPPPPPPPVPRRSIYGAPAWPPGWGQYPYPARRWYGYRYYGY